MPRLSLSVFEALLVGVGSNIDAFEMLPTETLKEKYNELKGHEAFSEEVLREGLSVKKRVLGRLEAAISIFS